MTASAAERNDDIEFEHLDVWPDEIRIGDIYGGYVITAVARADHYRDPAVRLTIYTDPDAIDDTIRSEEWGRFVLRTDRETGHTVPIDRPVHRR